MSTEVVIVGAKVDDEVDEENEHLCFFGNNISVNIQYSFVGYGTLRNNNCIVGGSIMQLACLIVWVGTMLTGLVQSEKRGGHRRKLYAGKFTIR